MLLIILQKRTLFICLCEHSSPDCALFLGCHILALLTLSPAEKTNDQESFPHHPCGRSRARFPALFVSSCPHVALHHDKLLTGTNKAPALRPAPTQSQTVELAQLSSFRVQVIFSEKWL